MAKEMEMHDNRMVKDMHQEGIERVKMRSGDLKKGQGGKMGAHGSESNWKRADSAETPRRA